MVIILEIVNNLNVFRRLGRDLTWQFFKDKFVILNERYSSGFMLSRLVKSSTCDLLGEERAREVRVSFILSSSIIIIVIRLRHSSLSIPCPGVSGTWPSQWRPSD